MKTLSVPNKSRIYLTNAIGVVNKHGMKVTNKNMVIMPWECIHSKIIYEKKPHLTVLVRTSTINLRLRYYRTNTEKRLLDGPLKSSTV